MSSDTDVPDAWPVYKIAGDGRVSELATFLRFDVAQRFAQELAESWARNDADRLTRGVPTSGVAGVIVGWDAWNVAGMARDQVRRTIAIDGSVPYARSLRDARRALLLAYAQRETA